MSILLSRIPTQTFDSKIQGVEPKKTPERRLVTVTTSTASSLSRSSATDREKERAGGPIRSAKAHPSELGSHSPLLYARKRRIKDAVTFVLAGEDVYLPP